MTTAFLTSWSLQPQIALPLLALAALYARGWLLLREYGSRLARMRALACFLAGLATVWLAVASPLDAFAGFLLQLHMAQHLLLMLVVPPLVWLGQPELPLLLGLPRWVRAWWVMPLWRLRLVRAAMQCVTRPAVAWTIFVVNIWMWHIPQVYELTLELPSWHYLEHASFFATGLLFWFPVMQPYPSRPQVSRWMLLPYLFLAGLQGTVLSAVLTFADHVLYPRYATAPRIWDVSPLTDQALGGAIMWIGGSVAYLVPLVWIGQELFAGWRATPRLAGSIPISVARLLLARPPQATDSRWTFRGHDIMRLPLLGRFLRWRHARTALQLPLLAMAVLVILDGLLGPQIAPLNLAGVLPWIVWRGLLVFGLLLAGNLFCMACPFMLVRGLAKRWLQSIAKTAKTASTDAKRGPLARASGWCAKVLQLGAERAWPRWLAGKWPAVLLLVAFFWAYEALALWDSPRRTACVVLAYFATAIIVDGIFRGAAFCKHVCPIGQFNFANSLMSPLEVQVRDTNVCGVCQTRECIRGCDSSPGCERLLFQPRKVGNMDCTFAMDCIRACPHDNIGVVTVVPGADLARDPARSGVGRFSKRTDLAVMVVVVVFAAFLNAAEMIGPVLELEHRVAARLGLAGPMAVVTGETLLGVLVAPAVAVAAAAAASRWLSGAGEGVLATARRFAYALVPLGLGMWLAHFSFHFFTSAGTLAPALQRFACDLGFSGFGRPAWAACCAGKAGNWLLVVQILFLDLGLLGSLHAAYRIARRDQPRAAMRALAPWAALALLLFAAGIWILFQPMQMRGTMTMDMGGM